MGERKELIVSIVVILIVPIIFTLSFAIATSNGYPEVIWSKAYDGGQGDHSRAIAIDSSGNVYVTGNSGINGNDYYFTIKYDPIGNLLWNISYGSWGCDNYAYGIAVDYLSNVYVTGTYNCYPNHLVHSYTIKYDSNGNQIWNITDAVNTLASSIAVDSAENVYVTGSYWNATGSYYNTIKYNSEGNKIWNKLYYSGINVGATGVIADSSGNVFVTGSSYNVPNPGWPRCYTIKYDSNGNEVWNKTFWGSLVNDCYSKGIATDSSGDVYIAGTEYNFHYSNFEQFIVKYDSNGNEVWNQVYNSGSLKNAQANGIAVNSLGEVYITGFRYNGITDEYYTTKYSSNGNQIWNKTYYTGSDKQAEAQGIAVDNFGRVYVTGDRSNGKDMDYYTIRYNEYECAPFLINTSWSDWSNVGNCSVQDKQNQSRYRIQYDANNCGSIQDQTFYEYQGQQCDFCTPDWTANSVCNSDDSLVVGYDDSNTCFLKTNLSSDLQNKPDNQTLLFACDFNKDGFIGNLTNVNSSINLSFENASEILRFKDENKTLFEFNFSNVTVNFANLLIEKQSNHSNFSYLIIKGLDLTSQNQTKTICLDRILNGTGICIKDSELTSISEITDSCTGPNEIFMFCPSLASGYNCSLIENNTRYEISGLKHSGTKEQQYFCGDGTCNGGEICSSCSTDCGTCPISPSGGGSGGGGGGYRIPSNITNVTTPKEITNQTIGSIHPTNETLKELTPKEDRAGITGAVTSSNINIRNTKIFWSIAFIMIISGIAFIIYNCKIKPRTK